MSGSELPDLLACSAISTDPHREHRYPTLDFGRETSLAALDLNMLMFPTESLWFMRESDALCAMNSSACSHCTNPVT